MNLSEVTATGVSRAAPDIFHEMELDKVFDAILTIHNFRIHLLTFFGTLSLGGASLALSTGTAGILFIAAGLLLIAIVIDAILRELLLRFYWRAHVLEARFGNGEPTTYLSLFFMDKLGMRLRGMADQIKTPDQYRRLRALVLRYPPVATFWIPVGLGITEIVGGVLLILICGWRVF